MQHVTAPLRLSEPMLPFLADQKLIRDTLSRPLRSLRVSVTDRCNLRCRYCMPEEEYIWLPREDLLSFEEIRELVSIFAELGVTKVRLTGGEPLVRKNLPQLVRMLAEERRVTDVAMTTNGVLLAEHARPLREAGLRRVTVSLDTLKRERFVRLARRDCLADVLAGLRAAAAAGFEPTKIDAVILRGQNQDEIIDLLEYGKEVGAEVRFLEYMDVGGATQWSMDQVFSRAEILAVLTRHYGSVEPVAERGSAPAERFRLPHGTAFGIIASTTVPFCGTCDRSRLTADGMWYLCLYATSGVNLREPLRTGASREKIKALIRSRWEQRTDRGAEERSRAGVRQVFVPVETLRTDPHLEMHTRGG